jgi:LacI family transcriptional regulator
MPERAVAPTLQAIADACGVSRSSVSLVLTGGRAHRFAPAMVERIRSTAAAMGWAPPVSHAAERRKAARQIALILGEPHYLPAILLDGIERAARAHGFGLALRALTNAEFASGALADLLKRQDCAGAIINYIHGVPATVDAAVDGSPVPAVWLNRERARAVCTPDDGAAMRSATERLLALGHRRILYVGPSGPHYAFGARVGGYRHAMAAAGVTALEVELNPYAPTPEVQRQMGEITAWLREDPASATDAKSAKKSKADKRTVPAAQSISAVVTATEAQAAAVQLAAAMAGRRIPEDLSLATIGDLPVRLHGLEVATWVLPWAEVADLAVADLARAIADPGTAIPGRQVAFASVAGTSLAPFSPLLPAVAR